MKEIGFKIVDHIGVIRGGDYPIEANMVEWEGRKSAFDLRRWKIGNDGARVPLKGLTLTEGELRVLRDILDGMEVLADE